MRATEKKIPAKAKERKNYKYEKRTLNHCRTTKATDCGAEKDARERNFFKNEQTKPNLSQLQVQHSVMGYKMRTGVCKIHTLTCLVAGLRHRLPSGLLAYEEVLQSR